MLTLFLYLVLQFAGVDQNSQQQEQYTVQSQSYKPIDGDWEDGD